MNQIESKKQKIEYLSYIIGLISFMVLGKLIGNNGITYMAVIIESISLFVLLINGGSADLIGKLIRARRKKNQYKEAAQLHKTYILMQCIMAVVLMIAYFFLTDIFAGIIFKMPFLAVAMKILTPIIMLKTLQCLMQGYFQGMGAHMPTVVSSIFRQLLFFLFGLLLTGKLVDYGSKVSALLNNTDYAGMYGAVGICLAILISEILVTLFLLIVYVGSDRKKEKRKSEDGLQRIESFSERFRLIFLVSVPEIVKSILKKIPITLCLLMFLWSVEDKAKAAHEYGIFYGYFVCICAVLLFVILMRIVHLMNALTVMVKRKDNRNMREVIYAGLHYSWSVSLFISVSMAVLAPQISTVIHKNVSQVLEKYYVQGSAIIVGLIMGIFIWRTLYTLGAGKTTYLLMVMFNIIFVLIYFVLRGRKQEAIESILLSVLIALAVNLIISFIIVVRKYVLQPDMIRGCLIPLVGAGVMGLVIMLMQSLLAPHVSNLMCLVLCLTFGILTYAAVLISTRSIRESEINLVFGTLGRKIFGIFIR